MSAVIYGENGLILLFGTYYFEVRSAMLVLLLLGAIAYDVRSNRIPNELVFSGVLLAVCYHTFTPYGFGFAYALKGLAAGLGLLLPFYLLRAMGAGDVKLMGMTGAFIGGGAVLEAALLTLLVGGLMALIVAAWNGVLRVAIANVRVTVMHAAFRISTDGSAPVDGAATSAGKLPYAVAIAGGTLLQLLLTRSGHSIF